MLVQDTRSHFLPPCMRVSIYFHIKKTILHFYVTLIKLKNLFFFWFADTNLITEGETSDEFYFYTLPSSVPANLECDADFETLSINWEDPTIGMVSNTSYTFSYSLSKYD